MAGEKVAEEVSRGWGGGSDESVRGGSKWEVAGEKVAGEEEVRQVGNGMGVGGVVEEVR